MKTTWFQGLNEQERENMRAQVLQSKNVLDKLNEIVYNVYKDRAKTSPPDYQSGSWAFLQAHNNGFLEALDLVMNLIKVEPQKN